MEVAGGANSNWLWLWKGLQVINGIGGRDWIRRGVVVAGGWNGVVIVGNILQLGHNYFRGREAETKRGKNVISREVAGRKRRHHQGTRAALRDYGLRPLQVVRRL